MNTNLVNVSFPKASVGCNGIDIFLGSFSMINGFDLLLKTVPAKLKSPVFLPSHREAHRHEKTRYTEEQIAFALKQAETGNRVEKVCRKMGISEATFYNWKKSLAAWA